jgi:hypothetical protein
VLCRKPWRPLFLAFARCGLVEVCVPFSSNLCHPVFLTVEATVEPEVVYDFPKDVSAKDKDDIKTVMKLIGERVKPLKGIVLFDDSKQYQVDLPKGWAGAENAGIEK